MSASIVVLTGAGISAESGIATFRASDGLWENHRVEEVATPQGYERDPQLVQSFYNARRRQLQLPTIQPNAAHRALAALEKKVLAAHGRFLLVTQNVDDLHERAGNEQLIHMHGELLKVRCEHSEQVYSWTKDVGPQDRCSCCDPARRLRPHIVWFGEMPFQMDEIYEAITGADYFISIGTSGHVYPAAGFVQVANEASVHTVELNLEPSEGESLFSQKVYGPATQVVPEFIDDLLSKISAKA